MSRRGITLLEVIISMFVLLVGLIGVFSLLPVAKSYMSDGVKYDATSTLGHKALHELETRRKFLTPTNWYSPDGLGNFTWVCPPDGNGGIAGVASYNYLYYSQTAATTDIPAAPWVIDPLGCVYPDNLADNNGNINFGPTFFPPSAYSLDQFAGQQAAPALTRVTIPRDNQPGVGSYEGDEFSPLANPAYAGDPTVQPPLQFKAAPMPFVAASRIFTSDDDLVFNNPSDPTQRPVLPTPTVNNPSQWSTSAGNYSWFAVIDNAQKPWSPGPDGGWGIAFNGTNAAAADDNNDGIIDNAPEAGWPGSDDIALWKTSGGELWHVWVAVVYKRRLAVKSTSTGDTPPERMVYCDFLNAPLPVDMTTATGKQIVANAGLGGGDCALYISNTQAPSSDWLDVKPNQWIMLSAFPNIAPIGSPEVRSKLASVQWFRLANVGEVEQTATGWRRRVTLSGPDWNPYKFFDALGASGNFQTAYATIVDGVTGVYEATIEQGQ